MKGSVEDENVWENVKARNWVMTGRCQLAGPPTIKVHSRSLSSRSDKSLKPWKSSFNSVLFSLGGQGWVIRLIGVCPWGKLYMARMFTFPFLTPWCCIESRSHKKTRVETLNYLDSSPSSFVRWRVVMRHDMLPVTLSRDMVRAGHDIMTCHVSPHIITLSHSSERC